MLSAVRADQGYKPPCWRLPEFACAFAVSVRTLAVRGDTHVRQRRGGCSRQGYSAVTPRETVRCLPLPEQGESVPAQGRLLRQRGMKAL